jgi:hypothetical protein
MRRVVAVAILVLIPTVVKASDAGLFGLDVRMAPGAQAGTYMCEAEVKNLESGAILSAPRLTFTAGAPASAKTTSGDLVSVLKVSVDQESGVGTAELSVSKAGKLVATQKSSLRLK